MVIKRLVPVSENPLIPALPVNTRRYLDVDFLNVGRQMDVKTTLFKRYGHQMDVKTTLCV